MGEEKYINTIRSLSRKLIRELGALNLGKNKDSSGYILVEIARHRGISISRLGLLLIGTRNDVYYLMRSFAKDGLVYLTDGPDKREKLVYLTDKGEARVRNVNAHYEDRVGKAFAILSVKDVQNIVQYLEKYTTALERNRLEGTDAKVFKLPNSRTIRRQVIDMITNIEQNELCLPITNDTSTSILKAEQFFHYNKTCNFWYAINNKGKILGSIGLVVHNLRCGELKKFFVIRECRGDNVGRELFASLAKAARKHGLECLIMNMAGLSQDYAHMLRNKYGFTEADPENIIGVREEMPSNEPQPFLQLFL
jgi:DNA-binding MarR family transcriptional regulator/N-acetylglutamate synthase-like GNAT family acetyltransferase